PSTRRARFSHTPGKEQYRRERARHRCGARVERGGRLRVAHRFGESPRRDFQTRQIGERWGVGGKEAPRNLPFGERELRLVSDGEVIDGNGAMREGSFRRE